MRKLFLSLIGLSAAAVGGTLGYFSPLVPDTYKRGPALGLAAWVLDRPVTVAGGFRLDLVPSLMFEAEGLRVGPAEAPDFAADSVVLDADLPAPFGRSAVIRRLILDRPLVRLGPRAAPRSRGGFSQPDTAWDDWSGRLTLGEVRVEGGTVIVEDPAGGPGHRFEDVGVTVALAGPDSPLIAEGTARLDGEPIAGRLETGSLSRLLAGERSAVSAVLTAAPLSLRFEGGLARRQVVVADGAVAVSAPSVGRMLAWIRGTAAADRAADVPLALDAAVDVNGSRLSLDGVRLTIGDTVVDGKLAGGPGGGRLRVQASLDARLLDLKTAAAVAAAAMGEAGFGWMDGLELDGRLGLAAVRVGGLALGPGRVSVHLRDATLEASLDDMTALGGRGHGRVRLARFDGGAAVSATLEASRLDAAALLDGLAGYGGLSGEGKLGLSVAGEGGTPAAIAADLGGGGDVDVDGGTLTVDGMGALLGRGSDTVVLGHLSGSFSVAAGAVGAVDLLLKTPTLALAGTGSVDPARRTVSFRLDRLSTPGAPPVDGPVFVDGPWAAPRVTAGRGR